jgi:hypothetical protein
MNFQDKVFESTADFRTRAASLATASLATARKRANVAAERASTLKVALAALQIAGRELGKVAGLHLSKFVEQNSALARAAGKDVSTLARSAYQQFAQNAVDSKPAPKTRKSKTARKRATTRSRRAAKAA